MKKKGIKNKISRLVLATAMVMGLFVSVGAAAKVSAATGPAPSNWAFEESSRELNDAIVAKYPSLGDTNGYVTVLLANAYTGKIELANAGINGTIDGVENFTQASSLILESNELTGEIPTNIGNMGNLVSLLLHRNNFTGPIPSSIGDITGLANLYLGNNTLTGDLPVEIGKLSNLNKLYLDQTEISGTIPVDFNDLTALTNFNINNTKISGEISQTFLNLPNLVLVSLRGNADLTGNPSTAFGSNTTLNYLDIVGTGLIQASPEIPTLSYTVGTFLYDNLAENLLADSKTILAESVTQDTIGKAQESADFIKDPVVKQQWQDDIDLAQKMLDAKNKVDTLLVIPGLNDLNPGITINDIDDAQGLVTALPNGTLKDELQAKIDTARNIDDAKNKVDELLTTPDLSNLKPGVDAGVINDAQDAVNKLPAGSLKDELQDKIDTAKKLLDAENKVLDLFNPEGDLAAGVDQNKIDEAQKAVNLLPNGTTKDMLQSFIDLAQSKLNGVTKNTQINKAPSISTNAVGGKNLVNTSDNTNILMLSILFVSAGSLVFVLKKRKQLVK